MEYAACKSKVSLVKRSFTMLGNKVPTITSSPSINIDSTQALSYDIQSILIIIQKLKNIEN